MFALTDLRVPVVAAPMAGGPSTPELVAAANRAGALGFLAAGNRTLDAMIDDVRATRRLTGEPFGMNLFVPDAANSALSPGEERQRAAPSGRDSSRDLASYRAELAGEEQRYGVAVGQPDPSDMDAWDAKIDYLLAERVAVVSFTFGLPGRDTIGRFRAAGTHVTVTVTDPGEASAAVANGADSLCVQGPEGGGHRGTHLVAKTPDRRDLDHLLRDIASVTDLPLVAAGGISTPVRAADLLRAGAAAVQLGTLLLCSPESGAPSAHKQALAAGVYLDTTVSRAFTGRLARGLTNRFIREHHRTAPAAYPAVNQLTRPLRAAAAAAGDADGLSLWAGTGFGQCRAVPAEIILTDFWRDARTRLEERRGESGRAGGWRE